ncbi:claudin domain-containing protein 2 isoform X3 [Loxodonta africana]|uniref:claudin domain-containing protein 2 isoform X3 n=1 Tax=Loxodonta africana TaxID=9785 RepID=UPI0030CDADDB
MDPLHAMLAMTGACMVLAAGSGFVSMAMGLRILCHQGDSLRGQTTSAIFFLSGLLLLIAMTGYTVKDVWKSDVFFSWSYFSGWLALPFSILAGNRDGGVEETAQRTLHPTTHPSRDSLAVLPENPTAIYLDPPPTPTPRHSTLDSPRPSRDALRAPKPQAPGPTFLCSPPARLLLSAGGHDRSEHRRHQWIPCVPVTAACLGQNKVTAPAVAAPRVFLGTWGHGHGGHESGGTQDLRT